jgi:TolB-like protein
VTAVFDEPRTGVQAATRLHRGAAENPAGHAWRAGLHVGDLVMSREPRSFQAFERAEALSRLAHPGTTAVAADDLPALGSLQAVEVRSLDATLPGEPGTRIVLLAPGLPSHPALARRYLLLLAGTAALGGAGAVTWLANRRGPDVAPERLTLGVGPFRTSGLDPGREWIAISLRDGLNTQLTEMSGVRVFSEEFIDFVMTREKLSAIETANRLGIEKMVTGTVLSVGDTVRVEARIVDTVSGVLEGAAVASGGARDYLALESEVVLGVIHKLGITLSTEDEQRMAARRTSDPEALRRFLQAEPEPKSSREPEHGHSPDESSGWDGLIVGTAWADDTKASVAAFLEEYRQATEARDTDRLAAMYEEFPSDQREGLTRYFKRVRDLRVTLEHVDIVVIGAEAVSSYTRNDDFVDVGTGRPQHVTARLTRTLRRVDGRWRFAPSH